MNSKEMEGGFTSRCSCQVSWCGASVRVLEKDAVPASYPHFGVALTTCSQNSIMATSLRRALGPLLSKMMAHKICG